VKRLIVLALIAFAGWYGWKHYSALLHPQAKHEAIVRNRTGIKIVRLRLTVGGHTYVKEELPADQSAAFAFIVDTESPFGLEWEYDTNTTVGHWSGGFAAKGPIVARHIMTIDDGGGVVLESEPMGTPGASKSSDVP